MYVPLQMLSSKDFFKPTRFNSDTKNQIWCSQIADGHDNICGCDWPFAHLLATLFPPGHADRDLTINQILDRDYQALCLSGGGAENGFGTLATEDGKENPEQGEENYIPDADLQELIDFGESAAGKEERR